MKRHSKNPLITPAMVPPSSPGLEVMGAFNPGATRFNGETILLLRVAERCRTDPNYAGVPVYRIKNGRGTLEILQFRKKDPDVRLKDTRGVVHKGVDYLTTLSTIRIARSRDGVNFTVDPEPFIYPCEPGEQYGCEDARIQKFGDEYWINYTAVSQDGWVTALCVTRDFKTVERRGVIFHPSNKDVSLFPEKIRGRYWALHRPNNDGFGRPSIWIAWSPDRLAWGGHRCIARPRDNAWESMKIGGGAAPLKTGRGWLEVYHGKGEGQVYSLYTLLLDPDDPSRVIGRGREPFLVPEEKYEIEGFFPKVVFSNGLVEFPDGKINLYYGACDETVCMAETSVDELLSTLP